MRADAVISVLALGAAARCPDHAIQSTQREAAGARAEGQGRSAGVPAEEEVELSKEFPNMTEAKDQKKTKRRRARGAGCAYQKHVTGCSKQKCGCIW
jgi:hypothetical protein